MPVSILPYSTKQEAQQMALEQLYLNYRDACSAKGMFSLALSGGSSPVGLYKLMLNDPRFEIDRIAFFWADERVVPHTSDQSNYGVFTRLAADLGHHSLNTTALYDPKLGVQSSLAKARSALIKNPLDAIILGIGSDGHTASLFPQSITSNREQLPLEQIQQTLAEDETTTNWKDPSNDSLCDHYLSIDADRVRQRVSLTKSCIDQAEKKYYFVFSKDKQEIMKCIIDSLQGKVPPTLPSHKTLAHSQKSSKHSLIFCDSAAYPFSDLAKLSLNHVPRDSL